MPAEDAFPTTDATWMHQQLDRDEEARRALRSVVMARYFEPLRIYVKGSSYRGLGESAELVSAFFVSRFARDDYLDAWRASGMPLRRWLINGLILSMREEVRRRRRAARRGMNEVREARAFAEPGSGDDDPIDLLESPEPEAEAAFERAWAVSILREACAARGLRVWGGEHAPYVWVACPAGLGSWETFDLLLSKAQLVVTPGAGFGRMGEGFFRISAFNSRENVVEAGKRLAALG